MHTYVLGLRKASKQYLLLNKEKEVAVNPYFR